MKTVYWIIIIALIILCAWLYFFNKPDPAPPETITVHDTTTIVRYEKALQRDTVTKWYEKVVYKESKPTVIYQQKIDTVFLERIKTYDLILGIEKKGTNLRVYAVNQQGMLLKEQLFENVYSNFSAFSADNKVVVKSQLWYWNRIKAGYEHRRPLSNLKTYEHSVDLMTGVGFTDRYNLDAGIEYNLKPKEFNLKGKFTVTIF